MRKKIFGFGRIFKDRINIQSQDSEFQKVREIMMIQNFVVYKLIYELEVYKKLMK